MVLRGFRYPFLILGLTVGVSTQYLRAADDILSRARDLATHKQRPKALSLLEDYLVQHPTDSDAQFLRGLIQSWEGNYYSARKDLQAVWTAHPDYADPALALVNVEIWSGDLSRAEQITGQFLSQQPEYIPMLLARAKVLAKMSRRADALEMLKLILSREPRNSEALDLRRELRDLDRAWQGGSSYNVIKYSDRASVFQEESISLKRGLNAGSLIFRFSQAGWYGLHSTLSEVDWYPSLRPGTYMYVNAGFSPDATLYPRFRGALEVFQNLGKGFESSAGARRLQFTGSHIDIFTSSLGRYHKNWYGSVRTYIVPDQHQGTSLSYQILARRYFGDGQRYASFRYSHGSTPFEVQSINEVGILRSSAYSGELNWQIGERVFFNITGGAANEDRIQTTRETQYSLTTTFYYRF
jgi:YaiO family outer membrane protein